jgi:hypothetical protein
MNMATQSEVTRASSIPLEGTSVLWVFDMVVSTAIPNYIANYEGIALSESWIREKGQDLFWRGKGFEEGKGMFTDLLKITPIERADGTYRINYFDISLEEYKTNQLERFKWACDKNHQRRFLPNNEVSFEGGEPTEAFCNFITGLAATIMIEYGVI